MTHGDKHSNISSEYVAAAAWQRKSAAAGGSWRRHLIKAVEGRWQRIIESHQARGDDEETHS